jgi:hypothetical protein
MANYIPGLVQIRPQYAGTGDADTPENVTWWQSVGIAPLTIANLTTIQNQFDSHWTDFTSLGSAEDQYIGSIVTDWGSDTGLEKNKVGYTPVNGTGVMPTGAQVAFLISLQVASRFKGGHGRIYIPTLDMSHVEGKSALMSAAITSATTIINNVATAMAASITPNGAYVQQVFRQKTQVVPHTIPPTYRVAFLQPVVNYLVQPQLATQRRRLRKAAHH